MGFQNVIEQELQQIQRQFEDKISGLDNIALQISVNESLSQFMLSHPFYQRQGINILSSYIAGQGVIDELILFHFNDLDRFYTTRGTYGLDVLQTTFFPQNTNEGLNAMFHSPASSLMPIASPQGDFIAYVTPLPDVLRSQSGTVAFLFNQSTLERLLLPMGEINQSHIVVFNSAGEIVLHNGLDFLEGDAEALQQLEAFRSGKGHHRLATLHSETTGLSFYSISDPGALISSLSEARTLTIKVIGVIFLVGLLAAGSISYTHYKPIKKLHKSLGDGAFEGENELEQIQNRIHAIVGQNKRLQENDMVGAILSLLEDGEHPTLNLDGAGFYICLLKGEEINKGDKVRLIERFPLAHEGFEAHLFQIPLQNKMGILVAHQSPNLIIEDSLAHLQKEIGLGFVYYHGRLYRDLQAIKHSYIEAVIACDYLPETAVGSIMPYRPVTPAMGNFLPYPKDLEMKLVHSIKQGSLEVATDCLDGIYKFFSQNHYFSQEIKIYRCYLVQLILGIGTDNRLSKVGIDFWHFTDGGDVVKFKESFSQLVVQVTQQVLKNRELARHRSHEEVFDFIRSNFTSPDLSVEGLAEQFDYSIAYLSKIIKEETGTTFSKFIQELRLEWVKEQLVTTALPIKDIITQSGYYDVSNFTRTFKKKLGITPGQYRELN
ncbi:MAG: AraC family transcriptional regulator [Turicibacter sp.]|nr:AraC family transcriptional regulator [Turicibacter sp.]